MTPPAPALLDANTPLPRAEGCQLLTDGGRPGWFDAVPMPALAARATDEGRAPVISEVNDTFERVFGRPAEEAVGRELAEVLVTDPEADRLGLRDRVVRGESVIGTVERETTDGRREFLLHVIPNGSTDTAARTWYALYAGLSALEGPGTTQHTILKAVLETSIDGILVVNDQRGYVMWNQRFIDMWAVPEELIGDTPEEVGLRWARERVANPDEFIEQVEWLYEHPREQSRDEIALADGRVFDRYTSPVVRADRTVVGRVWYFRDITARKHREQALERLHEASRELMAATSAQAIAEIASDTAEHVLDMPMNGVHLYDAAGNALVPVAWSEATGAIFGGHPPQFPAGEGLAWRAYSTGEPEIFPDVREAEGILNADTAFRSEIHLPIGEHGLLLASSKETDAFDPSDVAIAQVLVANVEAALDRLEREAALEEERDKYETLVERSHDGVTIVQDGQFVFANDRCEEILGYESDELLGTSLFEVVAPKHREMVRERYGRRLDPAAESPPPQYEIEVRTKPGDSRVVEVSAAPIQYEGATANLVTFRDVTERRRNQRRLAQTSEELEALNRVVRHDIRNDMSVILGWGEMLEDHVDEDGEQYLRKMLASGQRVVDLTETARDYLETLTSDEGVEVSPTALRPILSTEIDLRRESFPEATFRVTDPIPDLSVQANELLGSVFRNLLNNAVQHNDKDRPEIVVSCATDDELIEVRIADNGPGIPEERREAIFGKGESRLGSDGTGIGLYLVDRLVSQYGGQVHVEDNQPEGAVFVVELPRAD